METRLKTVEILKDFHKITGARISLHDLELNEIAAYPKELLPFCFEVQLNEKARVKCCEADAAAFKTAAKTGLPYTYICHCGLIETVAPIYDYGVLSGYVMMGQLTGDEQGQMEDIKHRSAEYFDSEGKLSEVCENIPVMKHSMLDSYINILEIIAEFMTQTNRMTVKNRDFAAAVKSYINKFYYKQLSVQNLCETFGCSRTTLMNEFKAEYGVTIGRYMTEYRLKKAVNMLNKSDKSVKAIAVECGFNDQNYFTKVFRANFNVTPSEFRKNNS